MNNKELLFNLIKKLESGELYFYPFVEKAKLKAIYIAGLNDVNSEFKVLEVDNDKVEKILETNPLIPVKEEWVKEFKENFYKEKGLTKCWVKDCSNKIFQKKGDYKKIKVQCQDRHTRMVCSNHPELK